MLRIAAGLSWLTASTAVALPLHFPAVSPFLLVPLQMATAIKPAQKPGVEEAEAAPIHRIRITLTSKNVKNLEKGAAPGGP